MSFSLKTRRNPAGKWALTERAIDRQLGQEDPDKDYAIGLYHGFPTEEAAQAMAVALAGANPGEIEAWEVVPCPEAGS